MNFGSTVTVYRGTPVVIDTNLPFIIDKHLFPPAQAVPDQTVGDLHAVDLLVVQGDHHGQGVSDTYVLCHGLVRG